MTSFNFKVSRVFHKSFTGILRKIKGVFSEFQGSFKSISRGIGGSSCGLINLISPEARSERSSHAKTSVTAKDLAKTLREQAIDSALNMTKDLINGNDMRHSLDRVEI